MKTLLSLAAMAGFTIVLFPLILDTCATVRVQKPIISAEPTRPDSRRTDLDIPLPEEKTLTITLPTISESRRVDVVAEEARTEWRCTGWRPLTQGSGDHRLCDNFPVTK